MAFKTATSYEVGVKSGGPEIRLSIRNNPHGPNRVSFYMNAAFVTMYFPTSKIGSKMSVQYGEGENRGQVIIAMNPNGTCEMRSYQRKAVAVRIYAWHGLINSVIKSTPCKVISSSGAGVIIQLPEVQP